MSFQMRLHPAKSTTTSTSPEDNVSKMEVYTEVVTDINSYQQWMPFWQKVSPWPPPKVAMPRSSQITSALKQQGSFSEKKSEG